MLKHETRTDFMIRGKVHHEKIKEVCNMIADKGLEPVLDFKIFIKEDMKKIRIVDVVAMDANKKVVELHLICKVNKTGEILKLTNNSIEDIEKETGLTVQSHQYFDPISLYKTYSNEK